MKNFINEEKIFDILGKTERPSRQHVETIIKKSLTLKGLSPKEAAVLLNCEEQDTLNRIFETAKQIKETIYGNRLVLFAPLYLSNRCVNNCLYCGFRKENINTGTLLLDINEIREETRALISQGHKRLLIVSAENPSVNIGLFREGNKNCLRHKGR